MYKSETEKVEVYFICYKKDEMSLVETYYDEILDIHCWYFNAYLAYNYWKSNFKGLELKEASKNLLVVAASRYLIYCFDNNEFKTKKEKKDTLRDLKKIQVELKKIMNADDLIANILN